MYLNNKCYNLLEMVDNKVMVNVCMCDRYVIGTHCGLLATWNCL